MKEKVKVFKAVGDETRIKILVLLSKKNICAKGIARHLNISEAAVSQHIKILKDVNLITGYKKGYYVIYDLNKSVLEDAIDFMSLLINDDISSINNKLNINDFNILKCKNNCKSKKVCCKNLLEED
ncbi:metalloregulator ArsR/SmtB family transcription factor [Clostridium septicum]|uniref:ArsR family transcriptional regulator n=1 Tax=Clostridium septicum TaxID=1504 RepID=A0A9N7PJC4_CLOSE|nr:metalloregulator ArsR/SmtB family transcription factor [Clostridium septicum]AYE34631.1 ArsR family transcriptional regulator [Clostridium septicum]MDU1314617.1 metalloregulator ArsR/SmtB family transcription factor [Clostridium septicum]QAS60030.1 ArsR family transcriptional regulator [Clostridium septicum]UEC20727.1 metalloregulator ArsR/SmtB family transcription factor [Clostridium septicum]USS01222.1 metalloregulator ArsR/SmtB family transcription factor [Clostridium septicum]